MAARRAHNPKVVGSNPTPATNRDTKADPRRSAFSVSRDNDLQALLLSVLQLPLGDRQLLSSLLQSKPASILALPCDGIPDWQNELNMRGLSPRTVSLYSRTAEKGFGAIP